MSKGHAIWFALSFALSFGTNHVLKPSFDYGALSGGPTLASGEISPSAGAARPIKLVDLRVIAVDVPTLFGSTLALRELLMRGALGEGQTETDLEVFVDLTREDGAPIDPALRSIDALKSRPLPVLARAIAGNARSRVRLPGSDGAVLVKRGTLTIDEALELEPGIWRVRGELDIELDPGDQGTSLFGRLAGRLVWE